VKKYEFESIVESIGVVLRDNFIELNHKQSMFIKQAANKGKLLFIENQRFTDTEKKYSDSYKINKALSKVLALEYSDDVSLLSLPGTTETFHAVIALPYESMPFIENINELKIKIAEIMKEYVDERVKLNGQWTPVNKALLKEIGRPRANIKQIRRRLNHHKDHYQRLSLSCTSSRPSYKKSKLEIINLLKKIKNDTAEEDMKVIERYSNETEFAYFYDKTYSVIDGNFRYKENIYDDPTNEIDKKFRTQKISSPVYIICKEPNNIDIEVIFRNKEKKQKKRIGYKNVILKEKILMTLPVFEYE
jgi:hypothetical protein